MFEGVTKFGYEGDMAIDDIEVSMGLCTKPGWFLFITKGFFVNFFIQVYKLPSYFKKDQ